jgi:hypothetical protein
MSIGFDPDHMDSTTEPTTQAVISGARHDATPRPTAGLDQATLSEFGALSGLNDSSKHWIAGTIKHRVARHRTLGVPE